jgi:spore maturation protein CgeB
MKLLFYSWNANNEQILVNSLKGMGFDVVWFQKECHHYTRDMGLAMEMIQLIHVQTVEAVVSFNYFPIISMICNTCQIPYYAWVYDCPHFTLYAKQIALECNHIGIFDREMVRHMRNYGVDTVYHIPLSVDVSYFAQIIADASQWEKAKLHSDISFVGSLYTGKYNYYDILFNPKETLTDDIIDKQCFCYCKNYLKQSIEEGLIDLRRIEIEMEKRGLMLGEDYFAKVEDILLAAVLEKKVTVEERKILLKKIAIFCKKNDKRYDFRLYTDSETENIPELDRCNCGTINYHEQMPLVFSESKINLNISLRSIHSGIPLRVLDIMACGGFVLSNWQPEIAEYFEEGVDLVTFGSVEDCLDKISYYLEHEEERRRIALRGRSKVNKEFSYQIGLEKLFCIPSCDTLSQTV